MWKQLIGMSRWRQGNWEGVVRTRVSMRRWIDRIRLARIWQPLTLRQGGFDINEPLAESVVELLGKLRSTAGKVLAFANVVL